MFYSIFLGKIQKGNHKIERKKISSNVSLVFKITNKIRPSKLQSNSNWWCSFYQKSTRII